MAEARIDPIEQIPDADLLEQQAPVDPRLMDEQCSTDVHHDWPIDSVNEADLAEQSMTLPDDGDEYPHATGPGRAHDA